MKDSYGLLDLRVERDACTRHPSRKIIGVCLNKDFLKSFEHRDPLVCEKCMCLYGKEYNNFLLLDELFEKDEFTIEEYPFEKIARSIKNLFLDSSTQNNKKGVFSREIKLIDEAIFQLHELKNRFHKLQEEFELKQTSIVDQMKKQYSEVFGLNKLRHTLNESLKKQKTASILDDNHATSLDKAKQLLYQQFQELQQLRGHSEVEDCIASFERGVSKLVDEKMTSLLEKWERGFSSIISDGEHLKKEKESVQLVRSRVPYPDALNVVLYTKESFSQECRYRIVFQNNQKIDKASCHFFIGCIDSELRDTLGYNHESPCICFICYLLSQNIDLSDLKHLTIDMHINFDLNAVTYSFNEGAHIAVLNYNFQPFKEWRLFINMCFPLKFKIFSS